MTGPNWAGFLRDLFRNIFYVAIWVGLALILFGQNVYDYIAPVYYKNCTIQTIAYDTQHLGDSYSAYGVTQQTTTVGQNGSKRVCEPSKDGYDNQITIIKQPINRVITYTANEPTIFSADSTYQAPVGGGAICRDGTRSYSTGRGTCSWHGGVSYWL